MYRSILRRSRSKQKLFQKMQKTNNINKNLSENLKTNTCNETIKTYIQKRKPVNFNNGVQLNDEFHFLLEEENRRSRNINDLDIFLL